MPGAFQHDVLIVGGGGAGLRAAIAAAETNPDLDIAVVSKVYPMRSHTVSAEGGAAGVIKAADIREISAPGNASARRWRLCWPGAPRWPYWTSRRAGWMTKPAQAW